MTVIRWEPFREVISFQNRLNSLLQERKTGTSEAVFAPSVDIYEDEQKVVLRLEVPGVRQDDLDIQVEGRTLAVRGERKLPAGEKQENFRRLEQRYGNFARSFTLPTSVDAESVTATCEAGVLQLELAKKAAAKPRQIKIGVSPAAPQQAEAAATNAA